MPTDAVSGSTAASAVSTGKGLGLSAMDGMDFLNLLITELSSQDPFEPMKNQDILEQLSAIRSLESNMSMTSNFETLLGNFQALLSNSDTMLNHDRFASATALIGRMVRGVDVDGVTVEGRVERVVLDATGLRLQIGEHEMALGGVMEVFVDGATTVAAGEGAGDG